MKKTIAVIPFILLLFSLSACNLPRAENQPEKINDLVGTQVAMTMAVYTESAQPQTPAASPTHAKPTSTPTVENIPTETPTRTFTPTLTISPTLTLTLAPSDTPLPKPGTIAGSISGYPYGSVPKLVIVAYGQEAPYNYSYWITASGSTYYSMTTSYLLPGKYQVVAYDASHHAGGCPKIVTVVSEQTVNCNITNWGGGYPAKPSGVPDP